MRVKTERLAIKILQKGKAVLERMAESEGEPVAVIVRKIIRRAVTEFAAQSADLAHAQAQPAEVTP